MQTYKWIIGLTICLTLILSNIFASDISTKGALLAQKLDQFEVDKHWLPSNQPLDWRTGDPDFSKQTVSKRMTHCSGFVAEACRRMQVYILRPPDHSYSFLANAQNDWLVSKGKQFGWSKVTSMQQAQELANDGHLVVAACRNPKPNSHGHIAILRPSTKTDAQIVAEGPDIIQAGAHNYVRASLKQGFKYHPEELKNGKILFFEHAIPALK